MEHGSKKLINSYININKNNNINIIHVPKRTHMFLFHQLFFNNLTVHILLLYVTMTVKTVTTQYYIISIKNTFLFKKLNLFSITKAITRIK